MDFNSQVPPWFERAHSDAVKLLEIAKCWAEIKPNLYDRYYGWTKWGKQGLMIFVSDWLDELDKSPKYGRGLHIYHIWELDFKAYPKDLGVILCTASYLLNSDEDPYGKVHKAFRIF